MYGFAGSLRKPVHAFCLCMRRPSCTVAYPDGNRGHWLTSPAADPIQASIGMPMSVIANNSKRLGILGRFCEFALEISGAYRLFALVSGSVIAWSAQVKTPSRLRMGSGSTIQRGAIVHCGGKAWCDYGGYVRLGRGVVVGPYSMVYGAAGIELDDFVHLGPGVKLMSQSGRHDSRRLGPHPGYNFAPIRIGSGSWIGAGAVILGGTRIGSCVNVSPNSVVTGDIPDYAVVVGNPSRVVMKNEAIG